MDSLKGGDIAEYGYREWKWMVSKQGGIYPVYKRDLEKLVKAGFIQRNNSRYQAN